MCVQALMPTVRLDLILYTYTVQVEARRSRLGEDWAKEVSMPVVVPRWVGGRLSDKPILSRRGRTGVVYEEENRKSVLGAVPWYRVLCFAESSFPVWFGVPVCHARAVVVLTSASSAAGPGAPCSSSQDPKPHAKMLSRFCRLTSFCIANQNDKGKKKRDKTNGKKIARNIKQKQRKKDTPCSKHAIRPSPGP